MNNSFVEQSLFDDLPEDNTKNTSLKKAEFSDLSPLETAQSGDDGNDWSDDFELIEELVGTDAAQKIAEAFAGTSVYIPKKIITNGKYKQIKEEFKKGASYRELALRYGYSEQHIRRITERRKL